MLHESNGSALEDPFRDPFQDRPVPSQPSGPGTDPFRDPFQGPGARRAAPQKSILPARWTAKGRLPGEEGIWVFIFGDLMIFAGFFGIFVHERAAQTAVFEHSRASMNLTFGAVNTLLLLTGSLFVVLGIDAARRHSDRLATWMLRGALVTGAAFVFNKYLEYHDKVVHHHTPGTNDFFMYYFVFTGVHLIHVLIGMLGLTIMIRMLRKPVRTARDVALLECGGIFWHLVDSLWIVLFALLYLLR